MALRFLDVGAGYTELKPELDAAVMEVLASGHYILGPKVEAFEAAFAAYCGARHCVAVANGLDALILSLRALNIGPGDEVIVPSNTFIATWLAVTQVGATLVPVEPDPETYNLDATALASAITARTRAIMPVHLYGQPADLAPVLELANSHGLAVIEDAAQAHGARYHGDRIGQHGTLVCWSFYPGKNLGAFGDAGGITTNDPDLAARLRQLRNYGSAEKYRNAEPGLNSRMDPLQAAVLEVKLRHLDRWTDRRKAIAARYLSAITSVSLPRVPIWADPVWHLFVIQHPDRDAFQTRLEEAGIATVIHYPIPPHLQRAYQDLGFGKGQFPIAEAMADRVLSLPMGPHMRDEDVERVIDAVNRLA